MSTRAERRREEREKKLSEKNLPHRKANDVIPKAPRMPQTQREMQAHLSGKATDKFRNPVNRAERREWDKFWNLKGRGFTKPEKKGERF